MKEFLLSVWADDGLLPAAQVTKHTKNWTGFTTHALEEIRTVAKSVVQQCEDELDTRYDRSKGEDEEGKS